MGEKLESGATDNIRLTTKTAEVDGKKHVAVTEENKDTGEVKKTIDGKPAEKPRQPYQFKPTANDFQVIIIALLQDIKAVQTECAYYLNKMNEREEKKNG